MKNLDPSPKVTVGLAAGAIVTVLAWVLSETASVDLPPEVSAAVTTIIIAVAAYVKRDPKRDVSG